MNATVLKMPPISPASKPVLNPVTSLVVCGEISSGKSSVINLLLRKNIVPSFFGQLERPMIVVRHGEQPSAVVHYLNGEAKTFDSIEDCTDLSNADLCEFYVNAPHIAGLELIEAPFNHNGEVSDDTLTLMRAADMLIWVTIGSQAWRLTERTIVAQLPKSQRENSILVVSRGDKFKSPVEIEKIETRLKAEASEFFGDIMFMHASKRLIESSSHSDDSWKKAKGDTLSELVTQYAQRLGAETHGDATDEPLETTIVQPKVQTLEIVTSTATQVEEPAPSVSGPSPADLQATSELHNFMSGMNGIVVSGIMNMENSSGCTVLIGDDDVALATGKASHDCLNLQEERYRFAGTDGETEQTLITMSEHFLLYQPSADGKTVLFMLCKTARLNSSIARNALKRMGAIWDNRQI